MEPNIGYMLSDSSRLLRRIFDERVRGLGLTSVQARLLLSLLKFPDNNQAYYAERLEVEPITLTRIVDRMEEAGWIERRTDPGDRRARILHLTEQSHAVVEPLRVTVETMVEDMLEGLSRTERGELARLLERIASNLVHSGVTRVAVNG